MIHFIATSDLHGNLKNLDAFSIVIRKALQEARNRYCPLVIAGDLNDTKAILRAEFVNFLVKEFKAHEDVKIIIIIGNHDLLNHFNNLEHSLEFLKILENVTIIDRSSKIFEESLEWYAIPYCHQNSEILEELAIAKSKGYKKIIFHQGIMGAKQSEYLVDKSSISLQDLKDFDIVLTGHYHTSQKLGNAFYFGSPFSVTFAEANQDKYIWYVEDGEEFKMTPIKTEARRHIQVIWEEGKELELNNYTKNDIIKIVAKGSKDFCLSVNKEELKEKYGLENLQVTTDIQNKMKRRVEAENINKPMEVIDGYLKSAETSLDKKELKNYLGEVCNATT